MMPPNPIAKVAPFGHNFSGERGERQAALLAAIRRENFRRVACPRCKLLILPETQARHDALHHAR